MKPDWIIEAEKHIGLREIPGAKHNATIQTWLRNLRAWWDDDETPWCGVFVAHCLTSVDYPKPVHWYRAKAYLDYGTKIDAPCYGCIVVFGREGGGHVGFAVGIDENNRLMVLGANQNNQVSVAPFKRERVLGYRLPIKHCFDVRPLPLIASSQDSSQNEA